MTTTTHPHALLVAGFGRGAVIIAWRHPMSPEDGATRDALEVEIEGTGGRWEETGDYLDPPDPDGFPRGLWVWEGTLRYEANEHGAERTIEPEPVWEGTWRPATLLDLVHFSPLPQSNSYVPADPQHAEGMIDEMIGALEANLVVTRADGRRATDPEILRGQRAALEAALRIPLAEALDEEPDLPIAADGGGADPEPERIGIDNEMVDAVAGIPASEELPAQDAAGTT